MEEHPEVLSEGIVRRSGEITPLNAADILAIVIDRFAANGIPLTSQAKGMIARQAKQLLDDGFDYTTIIVAAVMAVRRGMPQGVHWIAADLVTARGGLRMTRREYEKALEDELEVGHGRA